MELEATELQSLYDFELLQMGQQHDLQLFQYEQQMKMMNDQAVQTFKLDYKVRIFQVSAENIF